MVKGLAVFITSLTLLTFVAGCPPKETQPAELPITEPLTVAPADLKPTQTEPNLLEPAVLEPEVGKPHITEPNVTEPGVVEPNVVEPGVVEPNVVEPNLVEPNIIEVGAVEPNNIAEPDKIEPNDHEPPALEPNTPPPDETKPLNKVSFHNKFTDFFAAFVDDKGMVDYNRLRRKKSKLNKLLRECEKLDRKKYNAWPREDKIAFWINAYNIKMLKIIVDNYPIQSTRWKRIIFGPDSIRNIDGIWDKYKFLVMDEEFTLMKVEQRFFHKEFGEPRAFLAISYACLSGPPLRNEPYYGHKLLQQLDDQAKKFLSNPRAFKIDREKQKVYLSAIFQETWHGKEFSPKYDTDKKFKDQPLTTRAVLNFVTDHVSSSDVSFLEIGNYAVKYLEYDWRINDRSKSR